MSENTPIGTRQPDPNPPPSGLPPGPRPSDILREHLRETDPIHASNPLRRRLIGIYERPPSPMDGPVTLVFVLSLIVFLACIGYFLYGVWGGMLDNPKYAHALGHADRLRVLGNLAMVQHVAVYSGIIAAATYFFLLYHEEIAGYLLIGLGLILYLAVPALSTSFLSSMREAPSAATNLVIGDIRWLALIPAVPGLLLITLDLFVRGYFGLDEARMRAAQARQSRKRLVKRKRAPYLLLGPCWRKPGGTLSQRCLWDETSLRSSKAGQALESVMRRMDRKAEWDPFVTELAPGERPLTRAQKKQVCRHCRHFQAHQNQKYNVAASILAAGMLGALVFFHDPMIGYILSTFESGHNVMGRLSFTPTTTGPGFQLPGVDLSAESVVPITIAWVILLIACLIVMAKVLQLIEYCCFKLKI